MKKKIHPEYHKDCKVTCACGNTFTTGSTLKEFRVELCNLCHPFYTGKQKLVDTAGRVDKFKKRMTAIKEIGDRVSKKQKLVAKQARRVAAKVTR